MADAEALRQQALAVKARLETLLQNIQQKPTTENPIPVERPSSANITSGNIFVVQKPYAHAAAAAAATARPLPSVGSSSAAPPRFSTLRLPIIQPLSQPPTSSSSSSSSFSAQPHTSADHTPSPTPPIADAGQPPIQTSRGGRPPPPVRFRQTQTSDGVDPTTSASAVLQSRYWRHVEAYFRPISMEHIDLICKPNPLVSENDEPVRKPDCDSDGLDNQGSNAHARPNLDAQNIRNHVWAEMNQTAQSASAAATESLYARLVNSAVLSARSVETSAWGSAFDAFSQEACPAMDFGSMGPHQILCVENALLHELRDVGVLPTKTRVNLDHRRDNERWVEIRTKRRRLNELVRVNNERKQKLRQRALETMAREEHFQAIVQADQDLLRLYEKRCRGSQKAGLDPTQEDQILQNALAKHDEILKLSMKKLGVSTETELHQLWERPVAPLFTNPLSDRSTART